MNNRDLLKAIGNIDDKYLVETNDIKERNRIKPKIKVDIMRNLKLKYILAPICVMIIAVIGVYESGIFTQKPDITISKKDGWIIKEVKKDNKTIDEIARIPKWDEMSISQQFREVQHDNNKYSSRVAKIF